MNELYEALSASLGDVLDVEAGLRDILLGTKYAAMTGELADVLDVDTGLLRITASANPERGAEGKSVSLLTESATELVDWALEVAELDAEDRIVLRARLDPERWIAIQLLSRLHAAASTIVRCPAGTAIDEIELLATEALVLAKGSGYITLAKLAAKLHETQARMRMPLRPIRLAARKLDRVVVGVRCEAIELLWRSYGHAVRGLQSLWDAMTRAATLPMGFDAALDTDLVVAIDHVLDAIGDFTGADLRNADLTNVSLTGLRWSDTTRWPPGWEHIRLMSDEVEPGVYVVRGGTSNAFT